MAKLPLFIYNGNDLIDLGFDIRTTTAWRDVAQTGNYLNGGITPARFTGVQYTSQVLGFQLLLDPKRSRLEQLNDLFYYLGFDEKLRAERTLQVEWEDGVLVERRAMPRNVAVRQDPWLYDLVFESSEEVWRASLPNQASVLGPSVAADRLEIPVVVRGSYRTRPVIKLLPQKPKTLETAQHSITAVLTEPSGYSRTNWATQVTFDHAAAVADGKSNADGSDVLVYVNGAEVPRSLRGANTSTCVLTFPLTVGAHQQAVAQIAYADAGQLYSGGPYAQAALGWSILERAGVPLSENPFSVTFDHASLVAAGTSLASGADLRLWLDGV
jgi:hypothetical protein